MAEKVIKSDSAPMNQALPFSLGRDSNLLYSNEDNAPVIPVVSTPKQTHYKMDGLKRAIIINMQNFKDPKRKRKGSEKDIEKLEMAFEHLKFKVKKHLDCHKELLMDELSKDAEENFKEYDCLAVVIMTHGHIDRLECIDGLFFSLKDVEEKFLPGNCPDLIGKPKLFFIQACRGEDIIESVKVFDMRSNNSKDPMYLIPKSCDVLEFFSTEEGCCSAREDEGTWFIQSLAKHLFEYGCSEDLLHILTYVIEDIASCKQAKCKGKIFKQQPVLVSRLRKILKFE